MSHQKILVIEDNLDILELIAFNLEANSYDVIRSTTGENGLKLAQNKKPDLIILDIMLPGMDGLTVCRKLQQSDNTRSIPVLILTAKSEDSDVISGLELGAEDYITKPFSPKVLIARIRAALRRTMEDKAIPQDSLLQVHEISLDVTRHEASIEGQLIDLSATEFAILRYLMTNPGWVFSRNQIIDAVRGENYPVTERSVDVQILGLRKKMGNQGQHIETVRGIGYRLRGIT